MTDDVDARCGKVVTADVGAGPYGAPRATPWGTYEFHLLDPSGNGLQFHQDAPP